MAHQLVSAGDLLADWFLFDGYQEKEQPSAIPKRLNSLYRVGYNKPRASY